MSKPNWFDSAITAVEVSADDGEPWNEAEIGEEAGPTSWVRFEYEWDAQPGDVVLSSRTTDHRGLTQPITDDWNAKGYLERRAKLVTVWHAEGHGTTPLGRLP